MVVSGGTVYREDGSPSKPTTAVSSGTRYCCLWLLVGGKLRLLPVVGYPGMDPYSVLSPGSFVLGCVRPNMTSASFVAGIDAGGSTTRLLGEWMGDGATVRRRASGANPNRIGRQAAVRVLVDLVNGAMDEGPSVEAVYVSAGISGAGRAEVQEALSRDLRDGLSAPDTRVVTEVVHDGLIAMDAAYDSGSGIIVIVGTGSVVLARTSQGRILRSGGWGPILGDDGSGYALGRAGLRAVAEAFEGGADTALRPRVQAEFGIADLDDLIGTVYSDDFQVQDVAPLVVEAAAEDDGPAGRALRNEVERLTDQVRRIVSQSDNLSRRMTLLGGMTDSSYYGSLLRKHLEAEFGDWSVDMLQTEPVLGAIRRARRLAEEDLGDAS